LTGRLEVLKILNPNVVERRPELSERFLREIQSVATLDHENIIRVYGAFRIDDRLILAMEYGGDDDLFKFVRQNGPMPVSDACDVILQVAHGLQHALEYGFVHRDIKPQNLLVMHSGQKNLIKILDFGAVKTQANGLTRFGTVVGTPAYMAPEQARNPAGADSRADIYSLGCTLYYMLTGSPPFVGKSYFEIIEAHSSSPWKPLLLCRPDIDPKLDATLTRMLAKKPVNRFDNPTDLARAMQPFICRRAIGRVGATSARLVANPVAASDSSTRSRSSIGRDHALANDPSTQIDMRPYLEWLDAKKRRNKWRAVAVLTATLCVAAGVAVWKLIEALVLATCSATR
jgi:serine/threonine protein kinase